MTDLTPNDINVLKEALREAKDARYRNRIKEPITEPNFRALCAELYQEFSSLYCDMSACVDFNDSYMERIDNLCNRADAALATPPPELPTNEGVKKTILQQAAESAIQTLEGWENYGSWVWPVSALEQVQRSTKESLDLLRAALATPPPEPLRPIPVSERLPEAGEWVWHCYTGVRFWEHGRYYSRQLSQPATHWFFISDGPESQPATHWLPANAIPFPEVTQ